LLYSQVIFLLALDPSRDFVTLFGHPIHVAPDLVFFRPMTWKATFMVADGFAFEPPILDVLVQEDVDKTAVARATVNRLLLIRFIRFVLLCSYRYLRRRRCDGRD